MKRRGTAWVADLSGEPGALELLNEIKLLPDPQLSADEDQMLGVLARLLGLAVAELDVVFNELQRVDYPAIAVAARGALGSIDDPTDLALRLDSSIRHVLVDEFQDTSLDQTHLLGLLTAGWVTGDGRTLFLVGDPMQSIYGFREAEVGMFLSARTAGIGTVPLEALSLHRNFRSAGAVVQWINEVFARSFPAVDDARTGSVAYARSVAARGGSAAGGVHLHRVLPGDIAGEADGVARVVADLRAAQPDASIAVPGECAHPRRSACGGAGRTAVDSRGRGSGIARAAEHRAGPHGPDAGLGPPGRSHAWLAILRAPWCGLNLQEISRLLGMDRHVTVWDRVCDPQALASLAPEAQSRVRRLQATLALSLDPALQRHATGPRCPGATGRSGVAAPGWPRRLRAGIGSDPRAGRSLMPSRSGAPSRTGPVRRNCRSGSTGCTRRMRRAQPRCRS